MNLNCWGITLTLYPHRKKSTKRNFWMNFNRRIKLKSHFGEAAPKEGLYFKSNTSWEPPNPHYTVKTFTESFKNKIANCLDKDPSGPNDNNQNKKTWTKKKLRLSMIWRRGKTLSLPTPTRGAWSSSAMWRITWKRPTDSFRTETTTRNCRTTRQRNMPH